MSQFRGCDQAGARGTRSLPCPALSVVVGPRPLDGVKLYRVAMPPRQIVALMPSQYRRIEPYAAFLDALRQAGQDFRMPMPLKTPPFLPKGNKQ